MFNFCSICNNVISYNYLNSKFRVHCLLSPCHHLSINWFFSSHHHHLSINWWLPFHHLLGSSVSLSIPEAVLLGSLSSLRIKLILEFSLSLEILSSRFFCKGWFHLTWLSLAAVFVPLCHILIYQALTSFCFSGRSFLIPCSWHSSFCHVTIPQSRYRGVCIGPCCGQLLPASRLCLQLGVQAAQCLMKLFLLV